MYFWIFAKLHLKTFRTQFDCIQYTAYKCLIYSDFKVVGLLEQQSRFKNMYYFLCVRYNQIKQKQWIVRIGPEQKSFSQGLKRLCMNYS